MMTSAAAWLGALTRLPRRAFRSRLGDRVPVLCQSTLTPGPTWRRPDLRVIDHQRQVEFSFRVTGAEVESTHLAWDEETQTLIVHAIPDQRGRIGSALEHTGREPNAREQGTLDAPAWYAEVRLDSDLDGRRAEAFLKDGTLRVFAPRVDSMPMTALPLLAWTEACSDWSLAATT